MASSRRRKRETSESLMKADLCSSSRKGALVDSPDPGVTKCFSVFRDGPAPGPYTRGTRQVGREQVRPEAEGRMELIIEYEV